MLLEASQKLADSQLYEAALDMAAKVLTKEEKSGRFDLSTKSAELSEHGFFQGLSGIGYELARLVYPDQLPCVLLFE